MYRIFDEHKLHPATSLNGLWDMTIDEKTWAVMVPGVWERIPELRDYRGKADFSRTVQIDAPGRYVLRFGGVSHTAAVCWDGRQVAWHYNAYTAFETVLEDVQSGSHTLTVHVDNTFGPHSLLHVPNDYYTYGGLNRPVEIRRVGKLRIRRLQFTCTQTGEGAYRARVEAFIEAFADVEQALLTLRLAGAEKEVSVEALHRGDQSCISAVLEVENVKPWDIGRGNLYDLHALLMADGQAADDMIDRVGFRVIEMRDEKVYLNGREIFIKGFNRHEDHGQFGCALSVDAMMDDLHLMQAAGANSVRTCHYPNDPRFLDLCDALGLLVWEENHARAIDIHPEGFDEVCAAVNEEMVTQHFNHPCIWVWGILNECESETEFGREVYRKQLEQLRTLDPTRPTTFASCRFFTDICMDLPQVCSFNIYPRWYHNEPVADYAARIAGYMDDTGAKGKPLIFSEFGAGAIPGFHDPFRRAKWSEERQCDILHEQLTALMGMERVSGVYIWQFCDVRVDESWAHSRPRTMNNKGIVDEYRRPKMAFETVRECFRLR